MEALNEAEAERAAIQQTVANALQEAQDAQSALVWPAPPLSSVPFMYNCSSKLWLDKNHLEGMFLDLLTSDCQI